MDDQILYSEKSAEEKKLINEFTQEENEVVQKSKTFEDTMIIVRAESMALFVTLDSDHLFQTVLMGEYTEGILLRREWESVERDGSFF